jgi:hypothetical protein
VYQELIADFTCEPEVDEGRDPDGDQLTVKQLKDNIKRFKKGVGPIFHLYRAVYNVFTWNSPLFTLLTFLVYMYTVWYGWLLPVVLFLCIVRLSVNFLTSRGWKINVSFLNYNGVETAKEDGDNERALADKFNLVLQVARRVQNTLGELADGLEKIKNLLLWRHEEASQLLFTTLCVVFVLSCLMSGVALFRLFAMYMGLKMFVIECIYSRFPRFKQRHDTVHLMWKHLPTDAILDDRYKRSLIDQHIIIKSNDKANISGSQHDVDDLSPADTTEEVQSFCDVFSLPLSERPLTDWEGGWRVTVVDRDKPFIKAFSRNGRLYLTNSFLCVERYKFQSPKNILIPLTNITHVEKAKSFSWLPGAGMSIQVSVVGYDQPYTFGAIINRDDCFSQLIAHGSRLGLPWALEHTLETTTSHSMSQSPEPDMAASGETSADVWDTTQSTVSSSRTFRMSDLRDAVDDDSLMMLCS